MFRFGWVATPLVIFVVCGSIATKFCTDIDNQSVSSNMENNLQKINDVLDGDVIILRKLAKKTVKRVYIASVSLSFIQSY